MEHVELGNITLTALVAAILTAGEYAGWQEGDGIIDPLAIQQKAELLVKSVREDHFKRT